MRHGDLQIATGPRPKPLPATDLPDGYDEVSAKRVERELVELGAHFTEQLLTADRLIEQLAEGKCRALLLRIKQRTHESEADLARLMCEAKKLVRGE